MNAEFWQRIYQAALAKGIAQQQAQKATPQPLKRAA